MLHYRRSYIVTDTRAPTRAISTRVSTKTSDRFQELAEAQGLSRSTLSRKLIERYVEENENRASG
jgi:predicted DNA-binding protein